MLTEILLFRFSPGSFFFFFLLILMFVCPSKSHENVTVGFLRTSWLHFFFCRCEPVTL